MQPAYCNYSAPTYSAIIFATAVSGATQYEYLLTNATLSYSQSFVKSNNNFNLAQFIGLTQNTSYSVTVRVFFNSAWGSYGSNCTVTTPNTAPPAGLQIVSPLASQLRISTQEDNFSQTFDAMVFPNPYKETFAINLTSYNVNDVVSINIFDATGKLIEQYTVSPNEIAKLNLGAQYASGLYNIVVSQTNNTKAIKVVKP